MDRWRFRLRLGIELRLRRLLLRLGLLGRRRGNELGVCIIDMVGIGRREEVIVHGRRRVAVRFRAGGGAILIEWRRWWWWVLLVVRLLRIAI
jgi:hypothetical protein